MSIEVQIENRLKDTKALLTICAEDHGRIGAIRKGAMRGGPIADEDMKWMVRTLNDALAFKINVLELWIEDDTKTLETGYREDAKTEPQLKAKTQRDIAEAQGEGHTGVLEEDPISEYIPSVDQPPEEGASLGAIKEHAEKLGEVDPKDWKESTPPVLEGMDKIKSLLN